MLKHHHRKTFWGEKGVAKESFPPPKRDTQCSAVFRNAAKLKTLAGFWSTCYVQYGNKTQTKNLVCLEIHQHLILFSSGGNVVFSKNSRC